jgi:hypothetical protein
MRTRRALVAVSVAAVVGLAPVAAFARNGADDPKGHHSGNDHGRTTQLVDRRGNDDPKGHDANDDRRGGAQLVDRRGNDDPKGHDANDDHGRRHGHGNEAGDDNGGHGNDAGDDNGGR